MIRNIIDTIKDTAENIKNIKSFNYKGRDLLNAQPNNATIQLIVEDDIFSEYLLTRDMIKTTINIDILDNVFQEDDIIDIQDYTMRCGIVLVNLLNKRYPSMMNVYDYSFYTLSNYTNDKLAGVRLSLSLLVPSPIDDCNIDNYIDELNKYEMIKENNIDIDKPYINIDNIDINPIKL